MSAPDSMSRDLAAAANGAAALDVLTQYFAAAPLVYGHGTDNAADEAAWLFAAVAGVDYAQADWVDRFESALSASVSDLDIARMAALADQRVATRQPLAYLLGEAWFAGLRFEVTADVLVPRSPIAELIAAGYAPWVTPSEVRRVLEIGTGSGCIAIATALALPDAQVDASDVSQAALAVARRNVTHHDVGTRVRLIESDLFTSAALGRYHLVVTNPPYVDAGDMASRPAEFRHEPELGLTAGDDGLSIVRRLLAETASHLEPGGVLICEVGNSAEALQHEYATVPFTWLTFEHGGHGVFALTREQLEEHAPAIVAAVDRGSENT
ncbi:MAG: 50S ribosomal protein L3 N(5)-glutamine methyltransferase [Pseudomonadota bacterium]